MLMKLKIIFCVENTLKAYNESINRELTNTNITDLKINNFTTSIMNAI